MPIIIWALAPLLIVAPLLWLITPEEPLKGHIIKIAVFISIVIVALWFLGLFGIGPGATGQLR